MTNGRSRHSKFLRLLRAGSAGQALVELALTMPLLLLILLGAIELARVAYVAIEVSNAAEAAVRYGAQNSGTATDTTGMQAAAAADAGDIGLEPITVAPTCGCADGSVTSDTCGPDGGYSCTTGAPAVETLNVTTSKTFDPLIHLPGLPTTFTIRGYAHQKVLY